MARPVHEKVRSIKYNCYLMGLRRMNIERKYNGEYYQIYIDLNQTRYHIKIFSKSGENSIIYRVRLHSIVRNNLIFDIVDCRIKKCILEEELLIWIDNDERIESFHKIRKYVKRSDRLIGIARDSFVDSNKHFMIMFFDILLLDDIVCIRELYDKRETSSLVNSLDLHIYSAVLTVCIVVSEIGFRPKCNSQSFFSPCQGVLVSS
jgi:DNA ligase 4